MQPLHTHDAPLALHFRYSHLYDSSSAEALIADLALSAQAVASPEGLRAWARDSLYRLVPYEKCVIGVGAFSLDRYRIDRRECLNFSDDYFAGYLPRNPFRRSLLIEKWIESRSPATFETAEVDPYFFKQWRGNAERHGIANGVMAGYEHGVANVFSFVKLFNVGLPLGEASVRVHAIAPLFKDIWARITEGEFGIPVAPAMSSPLTPAQQEILLLLRLHKTNAEIAQILGKSPATVKTQVQEMLRRTGCASRHLLAASGY